jgi:hypothetical protein
LGFYLATTATKKKKQMSNVRFVAKVFFIFFFSFAVRFSLDTFHLPGSDASFGPAFKISAYCFLDCIVKSEFWNLQKTLSQADANW